MEVNGHASSTELSSVHKSFGMKIFGQTWTCGCFDLLGNSSACPWPGIEPAAAKPLGYAGVDKSTTR